jgi:hypothetical protein
MAHAFDYCRRSALSVNAAFEARDLVLHLQLAALEFNQFEVIGRVMLLGLSDLVIEGLMLLFESSKIRLDGHLGYLLVSDFRLTAEVCHEARHKSAMIDCAVQKMWCFRHLATVLHVRLPCGPW